MTETMAEGGELEREVGQSADERAAEAVVSQRALSVWRGNHAAQIGSPCANCAVPLAGPFCVACGQSAESFERSVGSLISEAIGGLFDVDARLPHTLRDLVVRPADLTRRYIAGRRVSQTPPLRLFLVVIVLVFFAGSVARSSHAHMTWLKVDPPASGPAVTLEGGKLQRGFAGWLAPRLAFASAHQSQFNAAMDNQLHETAILFLPISALLLGVLFIFPSKPRFFLFDHAIFSMHSLSFMGLLFSLFTLLNMLIVLRGLTGFLLLAAPTHLFFHLRGVYATSIPGTLARMLFLFVFSAIAVVLLLLADMAFGLIAVGSGA